MSNDEAKPAVTDLAETPDDNAVVVPQGPVLTLVPGGVADPDAFIRGSQPPVLIRVQFSVYDRDQATYRSWPYVRFGLTLPSAELAGKFRDDMDAWVRAWVESARG